MQTRVIYCAKLHFPISLYICFCGFNWL